MKLTILTEAQIRACVGIDQEAIAVDEDSFARLASGEVTLPAVVRFDIPEHQGEVDIKTDYMQGFTSLAISWGLMSLPVYVGLLYRTTGRPAEFAIAS